MPVLYDLPEYSGLNNVEDVDKYNKLPFYLANLEARLFPQWQIYNTLFGKISWQRNMGKVMRGVRAEPTPVGRAFFYPLDLDVTPNKDIFETEEMSEDATLKMHDFDSNQFHFLPSFQDFRENQLEFNHKDIVRQIAIANDTFIRTYALEKAPYLFIAGNTAAGERQLISAPVQDLPGLTAANVAKTTAFWQSVAARIGSNLSLAAVDVITSVLRDDIGAPYFEGTVNTPKDNDLIKGKYVLIGSMEAFQYFKWDPNFSQFRNVNLDIVTQGFRGSIFDEITYKHDRWTLRFGPDGLFPAPEVWNVDEGRTQPNPDWINAPFELAFAVGADAFKTIKVGPPPREFANKKMSAEKFYSMRWNGEVQLTDQVLVKYSDGTYDTNVRGRFLKLISALTMGIIPCNPRTFVPIAFARRRPAVV